MIQIDPSNLFINLMIQIDLSNLFINLMIQIVHSNLLINLIVRFSSAFIFLFNQHVYNCGIGIEPAPSCTSGRFVSSDVIGL